MIKGKMQYSSWGWPLARDLLGREVPLDNAGENSRHRDVIEVVDGDNVEMAKKARRDGIATAT